MNYAVVSSSLHPDSRSRILARMASGLLQENGHAVDLIDAGDLELPVSDGHSAWKHHHSMDIQDRIGGADGIILAMGIHNYGSSATAKNIVELGARGWNDKVVGLLCAAGGVRGYMGVMHLANSLMLDFHSLIIPRIVYATADDFDGDEIASTEIAKRVGELVEQFVNVSTRLHESNG